MKTKFLIDLTYSSDTGFDVLAVPVDAPSVELEVDEEGATPEGVDALLNAAETVVRREFDPDAPLPDLTSWKRLQGLARLIADEYAKRGE